jgi:biopolymer transport protein ExbD
MSKFKKNDSKEMPPISTASLPDIVFMLLFFFMVTTTMREVDLRIQTPIAPYATELTKLERKDLVSYVYIGTPLPKFQNAYGTEPRIQLNDNFKKVEDIKDFIASERESAKEADRPKLMTSIKADKYVQMGIISDVKQALRKCNALKLNYSAGMDPKAKK